MQLFQSIQHYIKNKNWGRITLIGLPWFWLGLFFLLPFLFVLKISLSEAALMQPPYLPFIRSIEEGLVTFVVNISNYTLIFEDPLYVRTLISSMQIAAISTTITLIIGYPMAYAITKAPQQWRLPLLMLIILPFWTSFLIRVYAWIGILKNNGLLNNALMWLGITDQPIEILYTPTAVYIGIVYSYLPFVILPLYATLIRMDNSLLEAAADLGCKPWKQFLTVTLPLSMPGIIAGSMLVFIPVMGEFVIPDLLGGPNSLMIGKLMWTEFFSNKDWPVASALAVTLVVILIIPFVLWQYYERRQEEREQ